MSGLHGAPCLRRRQRMLAHRLHFGRRDTPGRRREMRHARRRKAAEETGTRTSAQHGEGDRVGSARARVRAHRILPNFEQAQRGTECRRVATSRRGMSLPQADCRRGGGSTAAAALPLATPSIVPHTCVGAVGTEFHRAPPGRAFVLPAERDWAHPEVMRVRPRGKGRASGLQPRCSSEQHKER